MAAVRSGTAPPLSMFGTAPRPDAGNKAGRSIALVTNLFPVQLRGKSLEDVVQLAVEIKPIDDPNRPRKSEGDRRDALPVRLNREILQHALRDAAQNGSHGISADFAHYLAYDGRALAWTAFPMPSDVIEWETNLPPRANLPPVPGAPAAVAPAPSAAPPGRGRDTDRRFQIKLSVARKVDFGAILEACRGERRLIMAQSANPAELIQDGIQGFDVLLRHSLHARYRTGTSQAAANKFYDPTHPVPLPQGAEIWPGFFQSARPCAAGLVVNLDPAFSAFVAGGPFTEVASRILSLGGGGDFGGRGGGRGGRGGRGGGGRGGRGGFGAGGPGGGRGVLTSLSQQDQRQLRLRLKNVEIRVTHRPTNRVESFQGFTPRSARDTTFSTKDGKTYTIEQYFLEKYNRRLQYPDLPCVRVGAQKNAVPMEFCMVTAKGPIPATSLTPAQAAEQIRVSAQRPDERKQRIEQIRREVDYDSDPMLRGWGVTVAPQPVATEGRVINPPDVAYAPGSRRPHVQFGSWNLVGAKFVRPGTELITWGVLDYTNVPQREVEAFIMAQIKSLKQLGVRVINEQPLIVKCQPDPYQVKSQMNQLGREAFAIGKKFVGAARKPPAPQLFMVILDQQDQPFYNAIKKTAALDLSTPVPTQCVNSRKAFNVRGQPQYTANVSMKINVKLGGTNHVVSGERDLPRFGQQTMLVGADVTHPGPGSDRPSIAGSVATIDGQARRYSFELRTQTNPRGGGAQEVMLHSTGMMLGHLKKWQSVNQGRLPDSIVYFRDGVSEGQYQSVLDHELKAIKAASQELRPDARIKVTFVVCGKRHHVRFFAKDNGDVDRSGNLPPGTVVDTKIVSPFGFDFYLQSHAGLVGTARPCHYVVLQNEMGFTSENLIRCINSLCYSYCRATRAVSLVPPAYYADILCEKARAFVYGPDDGESTVSSEKGERSHLHEITEAESKTMMDHFRQSQAFTDCLWYM